MSSYDDKLSGLSPQEREIALKILNDLSDGDSSSYNNLLYTDYKERPVDIETFLHDMNYLGKGVIDSEGRFTVYPFWVEKLKQIFPNNMETAYNTVVLSGAIGIGKSFIAVICMLYLLHRMLCLKDPYQHYGLQPIDNITFSMLNLTMDAARGVGWAKMQELLQLSPWFLQHGWVDTKREPQWHPNGNIELIYGSQTKHIIGRAVFCLDGDTVIATSKGDKTLKECVDENIKVVSMQQDGTTTLSDVCTVEPTLITDEEYQITLEDGTLLKCTSTHKFLLSTGEYKQACDLTEDDDIAYFNCGKRCKSTIEIITIEKVILNSPKQYYDVVNANPYNNFLVKSNSGYVVSHNCNFLDEASFRQNQDINKQKEYAMELVSTADARMQSRFMKGETLPTLHLIASSKRTDQSFLESYIDMKKKNESKTTLVIDEPQWVIRTDKNSKRQFPVALGNKFLESEILLPDTSEEELDLYRSKGYQILMVPMGYYENFLDDLDIALTDIAGVSTSNRMTYISGERWNNCKRDDLRNPFTKEVITAGTASDDMTQYSDFFDMEAVPQEMLSRPLYIHMDMSVTGDKTGIAGAWIKGKKPPEEGKPDSKELFFQAAFCVAIKAPKGYQISFEKNRQFIYWLKSKGFKVAGVSTDTYQSYDTGQALVAKGYKYEQISMDRVNASRICEPYQYFKSTIYEERLLIFKTKLLTEEIIGLKRDNNGKIDHDISGINCFTGDTKVQLVDGRSLSMLELLEEYKQSKRNFVYSFNEKQQKIEPKLITNVWCSGRNAKLLKVTLDNGEVIRCTPEHKFMLRDGTYCEAQNLLPYDSLMPLYTKYPSKGLCNYRMYYEPIQDTWHYEHRQFAQEILDERYLVHHKDYDPGNNSPDNLVWCSRSRHQLLHSEIQTGAQSISAKQKRSDSVKQQFKNADKNTYGYWKRWYPNTTWEEIQQILEQKSLDEENKLQRIENIERLFNITWSSLTKDERRSYQSKYSNHCRGYDVFSNKQENILTKRKDCEEYFNVDYDSLSEHEQRSLSIKYARIVDPTYQERVSASISRRHKEGRFENAKVALANRKWYNNGHDSIYIKNTEEIPNGYKPGRVLKNHKVISVEWIEDKEDVYDITVEDNHNFALSAGVIVHNSKDIADSICGAIFNASKNAEQYAFDHGEDLETITTFNSESDKQNKKQITLDFEEELKKIFTPEDDPNLLDFGMGKAKPFELNTYYLSQGIVI